MCQGKAIRERWNILKLMDSIKRSLPDEIAPAASMIMTEVQEIMMYLAYHTNNMMYDRDAYDNLQIDFQIFLYLFGRILRQSPATSLLQDSHSMILHAPNRIREAYAMQLISMPFESKDYLKYGTLVLCDNTPIKSDRGIKRTLGFNDFFPKFVSPLIPKIHERKPPSILSDRDNRIREWDGERQRLSDVQSFRFLFSFYRMHEMRETVNRLLADRHSEIVKLDRELLHPMKPRRVLYECLYARQLAEYRISNRVDIDTIFDTLSVVLHENYWKT